MTQQDNKPPKISKFIVIIRPELMTFCEDACRAATFNHLLFRIAGKCKGQPKEKMQEGKILFYAKNELLVEEMSNAWGVCKVRGEVNELVKTGLVGRCSNPGWGVDRTKHFFFSQEQCAKFVELCEKHGVCVVHLDLPKEVMHLIYSSNANDISIKCTCPDTEKMDANDESIECNSYIHQMHSINPSLANDESIEAIYKEDYKDNTKNNYKEDIVTPNETAQQPQEAIASDTHDKPQDEKLFKDEEPKPQETTPENPKRTRKAKTEEAPSGPPQMPPAEMEWGTKKCLLMFDAWRGSLLISKYQIINASKAAKGLSDQYSEEQVTQVRTAMNAASYWQERGGVDIENVANNIAREIKKLKPVATRSAPTPSAQPAALLSEEQAKALASKAIAMAKEHDHEIQAVTEGNKIIVRWNTKYFDKPETFTSEKQFLDMFDGLKNIWDDSKKKLSRKAI